MTQKPHNGKKTQRAKEGPKSGKIQMTKRQKDQKGPKRSKEAQNQEQNDPIKPKARNDQWPKQAEQSQNSFKCCKKIQNFWKSA